MKTKKHEDQRALMISTLYNLRIEIHRLKEIKRVNTFYPNSVKRKLEMRCFDFTSSEKIYRDTPFEELIRCMIGLTKRLTLLKIENTIFPFEKEISK